MSRSFKPSRSSNYEANQRLRNQEFLETRRKATERSEAEDRLKLEEYLRLKGELE